MEKKIEVNVLTKEVTNKDKNDLFEILCYEKGREKQFAVVRGANVAADIVKDQTKGTWLGNSKLTGFHYRPLLVAENDDVQALMLYEEKEVYVHAIFALDKTPIVYLLERNDVADPISWSGGIVDCYSNGTIVVRYGCFVADFRDCNSREECEQRALEMALKIKEEKSMNVREEVMKSVTAAVTNELSILRLGWGLDATARSIIFRMADTWKNCGCVSTVKALEDSTQWHYAVNTQKVTMSPLSSLTAPLTGVELTATIDSLVVDMLSYSLRHLQGQIGFKADIKHNCYDFSFYLANGKRIDVFSSGADPENVWFNDASGFTVLTSCEIYKHWTDIIKGVVIG